MKKYIRLDFHKKTFSITIAADKGRNDEQRYYSLFQKRLLQGFRQQTKNTQVKSFSEHKKRVQAIAATNT